VSDTCIYFLIFVKCWKQSSILEVNDFSKLLYIYSYCIISSLNWSSLNRDEFHTISDWTKTHITWRPNTSQGLEHKMHVQSFKKNFLHMETNIRVSIVSINCSRTICYHEISKSEVFVLKPFLVP
jgi:hypothetical protein